jgi:hypothetical protein
MVREAGGNLLNDRSRELLGHACGSILPFAEPSPKKPWFPPLKIVLLFMRSRNNLCGKLG